MPCGSIFGAYLCPADQFFGSIYALQVNNLMYLCPTGQLFWVYQCRSNSIFWVYVCNPDQLFLGPSAPYMSIVKYKMQGKILPKFTKIMQYCAKTSLFSSIKHLFCLKPVKIDVSTYEGVQQWYVSEVSWADFELCFIHFCKGLGEIWVIFSSLLTPLTVFWPILTLFGPYTGHFWTTLGPK